MLTVQAFCLTLGMVGRQIPLLAEGAPPSPYHGFDRLAHQLPPAGIAVAGAWFALAAAGVCRAAPSGLDRLGQATGAAWILLLLIETALYYV
jgi:hypothetical protein